MQIAHLTNANQWQVDLRVVLVELVSKEEYNRLTKSEKMKLLATMCVSSKRMEFFQIPPGGWTINCHLRTCFCKYLFKFGYCVHVLYALAYTGQCMPWETEKDRRNHQSNEGEAC